MCPLPSLRLLSFLLPTVDWQSWATCKLVLPPSQHCYCMLTGRWVIGIQARVLLAVLYLLRLRHLRSLRYHHHHLHIPIGSRWGCLDSMVLAHFRWWLLLHRSVCRWACLGLPHLWWTLLHLQIPRTGSMGSWDWLAGRLAESFGSDCWSSIKRVWMWATAARSCIYEHQLYIRPHRPSNRRCHGCFHTTAQYPEQSEDKLSWEDDKNIRDIPHRSPRCLLHHPPRHVRQQARLSLRLDRCHQ